MTPRPRYRPLHPDFPVLLYGIRRRITSDKALARFLGSEEETAGLLDAAAPFSFTSFGGADFERCAPAISWRALRKIWAAGPRDDGATCDSCAGTVYVYGFAAQMTRAIIAEVCLQCRLSYVTSMTREALVDAVTRWGFKHFTVGLGAGLRGAETVLSVGPPATADQARAQLFSHWMRSAKERKE